MLDGSCLRCDALDGKRAGLLDQQDDSSFPALDTPGMLTQAVRIPTNITTMRSATGAGRRVMSKSSTYVMLLMGSARGS